MSEAKKTPENKKRRRAVEIIGYIIIFLIMATLVLVIAMKAKNQTVFIFKRTMMWVMTPSMEPEIPESSYILVKKATAADVKLGDVIVFRSDDPMLGGAFNTHRVIGIIGDNEEFETKGDGNPGPDKYTAKAENVVGIYVKTLPVMTSIGRFMFSSIGIIITITAVFGMIMIIYVPEIAKGTRRRAEELEKKKQAIFEERVRAEVERLKAEKNGAPPEAHDESSDENGESRDEK